MATWLQRLFLLTAIGAASALAAPMFTITSVGTLGGTYTFGLAINGTDRVTGYSATAGDAGEHAVLYDGKKHDLGTLGGSSSDGYGTNNAGRVHDRRKG